MQAALPGIDRLLARRLAGMTGLTEFRDHLLRRRFSRRL